MSTNGLGSAIGLGVGLLVGLALYKSFNGQRYHRVSVHKTRELAMKAATRRRNRGQKARVVKGKGGYGVYVATGIFS